MDGMLWTPGQARVYTCKSRQRMNYAVSTEINDGKNDSLSALVRRMISL